MAKGIKTRKFAREQLEEWDLPYCWADDSPEELHREQVDKRRWVSVWDLVFRAPDDGKAYLVSYDEGLTEMQDDTDPWNYDNAIEGVEVELVEVVTTEWKPVKEES
jgi:hypothetical protein